jgi:raffinose/stachyose/melibiose transport system permease protein
MNMRAAQQRTRREGSGAYWWFLIPVMIGFALVVAAPLITNIVFSLFDWKGGLAPFRWAGLDNYIELFGDALFWSSFRNTIGMIFAIAVVPTIIGLVLASLLFDYLGKRFGARTASVLRATYYLPQILPIAIAGVIWGWILNARTGVANEILRGFGVEKPPDWLGDPTLALGSIMLMLIWLQIGYPVVIFMSGLQRVDPELYEAAELDGANWWRRFRAITVPQIRPEVFVVVLTATVGALKVLAPVLILTRGGPESSTYTPSYYSYRAFFELSRVGYGAALATVLTIIVFVIAIGLLIWQRRSVNRLEGS